MFFQRREAALVIGRDTRHEVAQVSERPQFGLDLSEELTVLVQLPAVVRLHLRNLPDLGIVVLDNDAQLVNLAAQPAYLAAQPAYLATQLAYLAAQPAYLAAQLAYLATQLAYLATQLAYLATQLAYLATQLAYLATQATHLVAKLADLAAHGVQAPLNPVQTFVRLAQGHSPVQADDDAIVTERSQSAQTPVSRLVS
ncbi:MAG: hypothetical protein HY657_08495 [Acidobacteria bacterium]|nr:hypothetical protein [Acidobacteriota bacterium]